MAIDRELIWIVVQALVMVGSYVIGRYVFPKLSGTDLTKLTYVMKWVEQFVKEASTFVDKTGVEKKSYVSEQISVLLKKVGFSLTPEQISALIESAYLAFKKTQDTKIEETENSSNK